MHACMHGGHLCAVQVSGLSPPSASSSWSVCSCRRGWAPPSSASVSSSSRGCHSCATSTLLPSRSAPQYRQVRYQIMTYAHGHTLHAKFVSVSFSVNAFVRLIVLMHRFRPELKSLQGGGDHPAPQDRRVRAGLHHLDGWRCEALASAATRTLPASTCPPTTSTLGTSSS